MLVQDFGKEEGGMREAQVEILLMFANGLVTAEQAERLIDALEDDRKSRAADLDPPAADRDLATAS
jgi:hypothetical protein